MTMHTAVKQIAGLPAQTEDAFSAVPGEGAARSAFRAHRFRHCLMPTAKIIGTLIAVLVLAFAPPRGQRLPKAPQPVTAPEFTPPPRIGIIGETPLTLQQLIALALANNPSLKAAGLERSANRFTLDEARAAWMPMLGVNTGWENAVAGRLLHRRRRQRQRHAAHVLRHSGPERIDSRYGRQL